MTVPTFLSGRQDALVPRANATFDRCPYQRIQAQFVTYELEHAQ